MDFTWFGERRLTVALGVLTLGSVVLAGIGFLAAQYLQLVPGLTPLTAGPWTLPPLACGIAAVVLVQAAGQRLPDLATTGGGLAMTAATLAVLNQVSSAGPTLVVTGLAMLFTGLMPVLAGGVDTVTGAAPPDRAGAASALSAARRATALSTAVTTRRDLIREGEGSISQVTRGFGIFEFCLRSW